MKSRLVAAPLVALVVSMADPAMATEPARTATGAAAGDAGGITLAQAGRSIRLAERRLVTAAGSVLVLEGGVVVQARFAQITPPAQGFVYER
jgi:hypothetical protein